MPGQVVLAPTGPGRLIVKPVAPTVLVKNSLEYERRECNSGRSVSDYKFNTGDKFRILS
jgi:hypothetical protein